MKKNITLILPILLLFSSSILAQATADASELNSSLTKGDVVVASALAPPKAEILDWKVASTTERRQFYANKTVFNPSGEYESLYSKSGEAVSGLNKKAETGIAKLVNNNNSAPTAYYNNASAGTILKITNPHNGKTTYAVVVGRIAPADSNSYLLMLSDKVARNLDIKDYSSVDLICYTVNEH